MGKVELMDYVVALPAGKNNNDNTKRLFTSIFVRLINRIFS